MHVVYRTATWEWAIMDVLIAIPRKWLHQLAFHVCNISAVEIVVTIISPGRNYKFLRNIQEKIDIPSL